MGRKKKNQELAPEENLNPAVPQEVAEATVAVAMSRQTTSEDADSDVCEFDCHVNIWQLHRASLLDLFIAYILGKIHDIDKRSGGRLLETPKIQHKFVDVVNNLRHAVNAVDITHHTSAPADATEVGYYSTLYDGFNLGFHLQDLMMLAREHFGIRAEHVKIVLHLDENYTWPGTLSDKQSSEIIHANLPDVRIIIA